MLSCFGVTVVPRRLRAETYMCRRDRVEEEIRWSHEKKTIFLVGCIFGLLQDFQSLHRQASRSVVEQDVVDVPDSAGLVPQN